MYANVIFANTVILGIVMMDYHILKMGVKILRLI